MKLSRKILRKIAQKILDHIELIHSDDPQISLALKEGHERVIRAAKMALERWVSK